MADVVQLQSDVLLRVKHLKKRFLEGEREREVLQGLDLVVSRGEMVVLLGRSGSGKSTLLNLISGMDLPDEGTVQMNGTNLTALSEQQRTLFRRAHIGFVFQAFNLIPTLTVEENVRLPLELNGRRGEVMQERARELLARVGLRNRAASFPDRLSGGEQQRVAIARALVHDPLLVLADEPTGNLDAETGRQVMDVLERLVRDEGKTMLIATHDREFMALADRVLSLQRGLLEEHSVDVP